MKIALAQVDMRLGDVEGICARIEGQAGIARAQGASLMCVPAPLLAGPAPGGLVESQAYVRDVLAALSELAGRVAVPCLVPAVVPFSGVSLFEVVLLKEGRAVPLRSALALQRGDGPGEAWVPPVFDIEGVRVCATFDLVRDVERLPAGCDLALFFQTDRFDISTPETTAVASVREGAFRDVATGAGLWVACMAPVGAFDEAVYAGGSFVMDDTGGIVAAAPCFEEDLLVCEVRRGCAVPTLPEQDLPQLSRWEWLWEALRLYVRDAAAATGRHRAAVLLDGELPSSLAAVLAVDALGSRNVSGVLVERSSIFTPAQEAAERKRAETVRRLAENLRIELVEAPAPDVSVLVDVDVPRSAEPWLVEALERLVADDVARRRGALRVCPLTKTDYALACDASVAPGRGDVAPFGDVYLTQLEYLAHYRNRRSASIPGSVVALSATEQSMRRILARVNRACQELPGYAEEVSRTLGMLRACDVDSILEAHVDRNLGADDIRLPGVPAEAVRLLLLQVRRGEAARRMLPPAPAVSARSFAERSWPWSLAWSDLGRTVPTAEARDLTAEGLARAELDRCAVGAEEAGARMRGELLGLLGELLGLSEEEREELLSEEGQRRIEEGAQRFERDLRRALGSGGVAPSDGGRSFPLGGMPVFSDN